MARGVGDLLQTVRLLNARGRGGAITGGRSSLSVAGREADGFLGMTSGNRQPPGLTHAPIVSDAQAQADCSFTLTTEPRAEGRVPGPVCGEAANGA